MAKKKRHKFNAIKTIVNGITFPSKLEASVYSILLLRERAGEIRDIKLQASVVVKEKCETCGDGPIVWKIDFSFIDCQTEDKVYCEAKGAEVSSYKKRKKIWKSDPPAKLEIWKGSARNPQLVETIE